MLFRAEYRMRWDELDMYQHLPIFPNLRMSRGTRANSETADAPIPQSTAAMEIEALRVSDKVAQQRGTAGFSQDLGSFHKANEVHLCIYWYKRKNRIFLCRCMEHQAILTKEVHRNPMLKYHKRGLQIL